MYDDEQIIAMANNPEAKKLRLRMYDDANVMAADLISLLKADGVSKDEAIEVFSSIWDRVAKPDQQPT
jgi:hypothetical protein